MTWALFLIGKLEAWGIGPAAPVSGIALILKPSVMNGAQLKDFLRKLTDAMTFETVPHHRPNDP